MLGDQEETLSNNDIHLNIVEHRLINISRYKIAILLSTKIRSTMLLKFSTLVND